MVLVKSDLYFSGIDGPTFFTFRLSTSHHRAVYKEAERYKYSTTAVDSQG
jgi:hypothetical protein